ncbi:MAG: hypothetical protein ACKOQO_06535, partial [Candidatus Limnocylindrus sp.]
MPALAEPLGVGLRSAIAAVQRELGGDAVLVPIPTDPARLRDRGFDHAALIATAAAQSVACTST